jgi:anthranilate phosphoribosyltransferase
MSRNTQCSLPVKTNPDTNLIAATDSLQRGQSLSPEEVVLAGQALSDASVSEHEKASFLIAWQRKGETASEVASLARYFLKMARNPGLEAFSKDAIDIVGTGGDRSGTFNISTTTAMIVAAGGVPVIKHGNRSITSQAGSADLLESLGIPLHAEDSLLRCSLEKHHFSFLFAPAFHPAFKAIVPVRKALASAGHKSVFNILGPLINPARPAYQMLGVYDQRWVGPLAETLTHMGIQRGWVLHCECEGQLLDEATAIGTLHVREAGALQATATQELHEWSTSRPKGKLVDLKGGAPDVNLRMFGEVVRFQANPILLDTLCMNAGMAFFLAGKTKSVGHGHTFAEELLRSGAVLEWTQAIQSFYKHGA